MMDVVYSNILYAAAERWGRTVPPPENRPAIEDGHPLAAQLPVVETLRWAPPAGQPQREKAEIAIVYDGERWSFAFNFSSGACSGAYLPFPKFCDPYPTRGAAVAAAADRIRLHNPISPALDAWLISLLHDVQQLSLFADC